VTLLYSHSDGVIVIVTLL